MKNSFSNLANNQKAVMTAVQSLKRSLKKFCKVLGSGAMQKSLEKVKIADNIIWMTRNGVGNNCSEIIWKQRSRNIYPDYTIPGGSNSGKSFLCYHQISINDLIKGYFNKQVNKQQNILHKRKSLVFVKHQSETGSRTVSSVQQLVSDIWNNEQSIFLEEKEEWLQKAILDKRQSYEMLFSKGEMIRFVGNGCLKPISFSKSPKNSIGWDVLFYHKGDVGLVVKEQIKHSVFVTDEFLHNGYVRFFRKVDLLLTSFYKPEYRDAWSDTKLESPKLSHVAMFLPPNKFKSITQQRKLFEKSQNKNFSTKRENL